MEVVNLTVSDINFEFRTVRVLRGKFQKDRVVPMSKIAAKYLRHYVLSVRGELMKICRGGRTESLFISNGGVVFTPSSLYDQIMGYLKAVGGKKKLSLHSFRHTIATHMIEWGMPLRMVQELLGHSDISYTMKYVHIGVRHLEVEYRRCHPLARG